nr:hypothetical protein [Turneriella parva]
MAAQLVKSVARRADSRARRRIDRAGGIAFKLAMRGLRSRNTEFERIAGFLTHTNIEARSANQAVVLAPTAKL